MEFFLVWQKLNILPPQENKITKLNYNGVDLLITKNNNKFYAIVDECPHEGVKLSLGCIKNNAIKCSLHGFSFNLETLKCDEDSIANIISYPVKLQNNELWIKMT